MIIQAYLNFAGRCEEAVEFYRRALGAEVLMMMRFKDAPEMGEPSARPPGDKIMHSAFRVGDTTLMATDGPSQGGASFSGINLSLSVSTDAEAARCFAALSDGGQVGMPLSKTFFSSSFGTLTDRFGVSWMVLVPTEPAPS